MAGTFPTLNRGIEIARTAIYSTKVLESQSGKEQRASYQASPRYRYKIPLEALRQDAGGDEAATLTAFYDSQRGRWGTFNFTDPYDGVVRVCRFESDELELQRVLARIWGATVSLVSVK